MLKKHITHAMQSSVFFFEVNEKKLFIDKIKGFEQKMSGKYTQKNNCNFIIILYTYTYVCEFKPQSNNQYL